MTTVLVLSAVAVVAVAVAVGCLVVVRRRGGRPPAAPERHAAAQVLELIGRAGPSLRDGLRADAVDRALPPLRQVLGVPGLALFEPDGTALGSAGSTVGHLPELSRALVDAADVGRRTTVDLEPCSDPRCGVRRALLLPVVTAGRPAAVLAVLHDGALDPTLLSAADRTSEFIAFHLDLAGADRDREALARAEVKALRAQISPHFVYNALSTIASFVRVDPDRARELLLDFADYTRYSFRRAGDFTTLADELGNIDRYLTLERARFGDRLQVRLRIAPEVLGVVVPFLAIQPLVENAVRHGLAPRPQGGTLTLEATDVGADCLISIEDDGIGMDPAAVGLADQPTGKAWGDSGETHVGLGNVDDRLRAVFGEDYGLVVETAPGAGTKVTVRVPKFAPGVRAD